MNSDTTRPRCEKSPKITPMNVSFLSNHDDNPYRLPPAGVLSFGWNAIGERTDETYRSATDNRPFEQQIAENEFDDSMSNHRSSEAIDDGRGRNERNGEVGIEAEGHATSKPDRATGNDE